MKKTARFFAIYALLTGLAVLPFWNIIYQKLQVKGLDGNYSQLLIKAVRGDYEIFLDNVSKGNVTHTEEKEVNQIKPGKRELKLVRKSDLKDFYYVLQKNIEFLPSTQVEVTWESGPTLESSSGVLKYFSQIIKPEGAQISVVPFPYDANVQIDAKKMIGNLSDIYDTSTHYISISKGEGFETKNIAVNLTNDLSKKVLTNIKLNIEIYLYTQPFM